MKSNTKKVLKWLSGIIFCILMLIGLAIYTLICFQRENISRYSYCYFVCVSPEIKNIPLIGLVGNPRYASSIEMLDENTEYSAYKVVKFTSNQSEEQIINEIENYLSSIRFQRVKYETKESSLKRRNIYLNYKRSDSEILLSISINTAIDGYSESDINYVHISQEYNYEGEKIK
jgi:hypothetical protein